MKMIRILLSLVVWVSAASFLSSCESSKIAYGNSYYFKQTPKKIAARETKEQDLVASIEKESADVLSVDEKVKESLGHVVTLARENEELKSTLRTEKRELSHPEKKLIKQERRENKRAMRKELKTLIKEYRAAPKEVKESFSLEEEEVTGYLRTGIILSIVGLLLMILGGGSVLGVIGVIALVAGLVFILIDLI